MSTCVLVLQSPCRCLSTHQCPRLAQLPPVLPLDATRIQIVSDSSFVLSFRWHSVSLSLRHCTLILLDSSNPARCCYTPRNPIARALLQGRIPTLHYPDAAVLPTTLAHSEDIWSRRLWRQTRPAIIQSRQLGCRSDMWRRPPGTRERAIATLILASAFWLLETRGFICTHSSWSTHHCCYNGSRQIPVSSHHTPWIDALERGVHGRPRVGTNRFLEKAVCAYLRGASRLSIADHRLRSWSSFAMIRSWLRLEI